MQYVSTFVILLIPTCNIKVYLQNRFENRGYKKSSPTSSDFIHFSSLITMHSCTKVIKPTKMWDSLPYNQLSL